MHNSHEAFAAYSILTLFGFLVLAAGVLAARRLRPDEPLWLRLLRGCAVALTAAGVILFFGAYGAG